MFFFQAEKLFFCIFGCFKLFSSAKIEFLPFLKWQKMCFCTYENVKKCVFGWLHDYIRLKSKFFEIFFFTTGKAKYLIGVIFDPVLAVFKFCFHEIFVVIKKYYFRSELCNFTNFLLQQYLDRTCHIFLRHASYLSI